MPSFSYTSSSSSYSTNHNGQQSGRSHQETSRTTAEGTTVRTTTQNLGERPVTQTHQYDLQGRELIGDDGSGNPGHRIEDISQGQSQAQVQGQADHLYEERVKDENANRKGGA